MNCDVAVIGAGPAGLSAAIEAAKCGAKVILIDEAVEPGGQLCKQTHKFFGGKEHKAGIRGIDIASQLTKEAEKYGVEMVLETTVWGIFENNLLSLYRKNSPNGNRIQKLQARKILIATGALENTLAFPGWTLPGVMGAGAAQTMVNVHRVVVGDRILMVGSGNVGLIVSYQLMQAGAEVVGVVEILPHVGGYWVHASKITRLGVPIFTSHAVKEVQGDGKVEMATIVEVDSHFNPLTETEKTFHVDTVCISVGLTPLAELAWMSGCEFMYLAELGGFVPVHDENMETTVKGIYVAGDAAGIEEASTAMMQGAIAGLAASESLGHLSKEEYEKRKREKVKSTGAFRRGMFEFRSIARKEFGRKEGRVKQWLRE
jgi:NADPH-dependent 2,4-dienoyl-CoA reductase/sulfur reductase-like enzyme